jgi:hypothetical protein
MATEVERKASEREKRDEDEREDADALPYDGGFARLELPGAEPSDQR